MLKNKYINIGAVSLVVATLLFSGKLFASGTNSFTQSYNADASVLDGMLVELSPKDSKTVIPLKQNDTNKLTGVVVPLNDSVLALSNSSASHQVLVATSGRQNILVSNQGGSIKIGDYLSMSSIDGVAMKATNNQQYIVAQAAGNYISSQNSIGTLYSKKSKINISVGLIPVDIKLAPNPLFENTITRVPRFITRLADGIVNKNVSPIRIYLSIGVLLTTLIIVTSIFYSGVRSGIIAMGRNPLARKTINIGIFRTILLGLTLFVLGVFSIYLILL